MIITRTPFRISFFGGGTDYPTWYCENGGAVLSTTIDKYCYISCRSLPPFFDYKHGITYSKHEYIHEINEIKHPAIREVFRFLDINKGLQIHHDGDLPARSGIGSSSSFTVGLLNALYGHRGQMVSKKRLMMDAIHVEQNMIKENVGSQDQAATAFGGINKIEFSEDCNIHVQPIMLPPQRMAFFQDHLMLFFTGLTRIASDVAGHKISQLKDRKEELITMRSFVDNAIDILIEGNNIDDFGNLLNETWKLKKSLSNRVSNNHIDEIYHRAIKSGALGGKILGAGGGGFILFFINPEKRDILKEALSDLLYVPFHFEFNGSQIVYFREEGE